MTPCIITAAITGSVPRKADNPAVPISPAEQIEAAHACFEAGAALAHLHMRDDKENTSGSIERFTEVAAGIRRHCPGMIVQFSTGGRGLSFADRAGSIALKPDMASLTPGSVNLGEMVYANPLSFVRELAASMREHEVRPEIEIFDLSMIHVARGLVEQGMIPADVHVQFVLSAALPASERILDLLVAELTRELPNATWGAAGIGRYQLPVNGWVVARGGHIRTGFEDNLRWDATRLAKSNAELVARAAGLCRDASRPPATPAQARSILKLRPAG